MPIREAHLLKLANEEARNLSNDSVGTEHLLLALSRQIDSKAGKALAARGITYKLLLETIRPTIIKSDKLRSIGSISVRMDAKEAIEFALEESRALSDSVVGPEHILLGIIRISSGTAVCALQMLGTTSESIRNSVLRQIGIE